MLRQDNAFPEKKDPPIKIFDTRNFIGGDFSWVNQHLSFLLRRSAELQFRGKTERSMNDQKFFLFYRRRILFRNILFN